MAVVGCCARSGVTGAEAAALVVSTDDGTVGDPFPTGMLDGAKLELDGACGPLVDEPATADPGRVSLLFPPPIGLTGKVLTGEETTPPTVPGSDDTAPPPVMGFVGAAGVVVLMIGCVVVCTTPVVVCTTCWVPVAVACVVEATFWVAVWVVFVAAPVAVCVVFWATVVVDCAIAVTCCVPAAVLLVFATVAAACVVEATC